MYFTYAITSKNFFNITRFLITRHVFNKIASPKSASVLCLGFSDPQWRINGTLKKRSKGRYKVNIFLEIAVYIERLVYNLSLLCLFLKYVENEIFAMCDYGVVNVWKNANNGCQNIYGNEYGFIETFHIGDVNSKNKLFRFRIHVCELEGASSATTKFKAS